MLRNISIFSCPGLEPKYYRTCAFCDWLLHCILFSRFIHIVVLLSLTAAQYLCKINSGPTADIILRLFKPLGSHKMVYYFNLCNECTYFCIIYIISRLLTIFDTIAMLCKLSYCLGNSEKNKKVNLMSTKICSTDAIIDLAFLISDYLNLWVWNPHIHSHMCCIYMFFLQRA